jgi:hypothetical protein
LDFVIKETYMKIGSRISFVAAVLLFAGLVISIASAEQDSKPVKVVQLTGLVGVKDNAKGTPSVDKGDLHFAHAKQASDVTVASIEDDSAGADSQGAIGKTVSMASMAAPYDGGRFLALFRTKIDTLTVQYCDADGGLHGAIFTMPAGTAETIKQELVAQGAHTSVSQAPVCPSPPLERNNSDESDSGRKYSAVRLHSASLCPPSVRPQERARQDQGSSD